jgi:hypothetical protein
VDTGQGLYYRRRGAGLVPPLLEQRADLHRSTADAFKPATTYWLKDDAFLSGYLTVRRYF